MPSTPIRCHDEVFLPHSQEQVWAILCDIERYPEWWPKQLGVRVTNPGLNGVGTALEIHPAGSRPFFCRIETMDAPHKLETCYLGGFIEGNGEWLLEEQPGGTRLRYRLDVCAKGWLVALLGKLMDLGSVHTKLMQKVLENLSARLDQKPNAATAAES